MSVMLKPRQHIRVGVGERARQFDRQRVTADHQQHRGQRPHDETPISVLLERALPDDIRSSNQRDTRADEDDLRPDRQGFAARLSSSGCSLNCRDGRLQQQRRQSQPREPPIVPQIQ